MGGSANNPHLPSAFLVFETLLAYLNWYFDHLDVFIARDFCQHTCHNSVILPENPAIIFFYLNTIRIKLSLHADDFRTFIIILIMSKVTLPVSNHVEQTSRRPLSSLLSPTSNKILRIISEILERTWCSCRKPEFCSQHPHGVAHNSL